MPNGESTDCGGLISGEIADASETEFQDFLLAFNDVFADFLDSLVNCIKPFLDGLCVASVKVYGQSGEYLCFRGSGRISYAAAWHNGGVLWVCILGYQKGYNLQGLAQFLEG